MNFKSHPLLHPTIVAALSLASVAVAPVASAAIISVDLNGGVVDAYTTGAGVFGGPSTQWNDIDPGSSPNNVALIDGTGASSSVTVSWTANSSTYTGGLTGAFANLGGLEHFT